VQKIYLLPNNPASDQQSQETCHFVQRGGEGADDFPRDRQRKKRMHVLWAEQNRASGGKAHISVILS